MSRIATMGTFSCATIAIAGFKKEDLLLNRKYEEDPSIQKGAGLSVDRFYSEILYPTSQPLGKTAEYPFDLLMKELNDSKMANKFTILTLSESQTKMDKGYWLKKLEQWGFSLIDKTKNDIGEVCHIFTRNIARTADMKKEAAN